MKPWNSTIERRTALRKMSVKKMREKILLDELHDKLRKRSGGICEKCKKNRAKEPHHVLRKGPYPMHKWNPKICLYVCRGCHEWFEKNIAEGEWWVAENRPEIWEMVIALKFKENSHGN